MPLHQLTGTFLDRILENAEREILSRKSNTPISQLEREAQATAPALSLSHELRTNGISVIAEIKRASPSKGLIAQGIDASEVARDYLAGGCAAVSVLTDETFFGGSLTDLRDVAAIAHHDPQSRPVVRKDFIVDPYQIVEARAAGADAILLIVAALSDDQFIELYRVASEYAMDSVIEVHDESELERALRVSPAIIGINNRDLRTFEVDLKTTERLAPRVPEGTVIIGESGIRNRDDVKRLEQAGVNAVLVGESLMRTVDRIQAVKDLTR